MVSSREASAAVAVRDSGAPECARLVVLNADDRRRLNRFVTDSPQGHFRQLYEWGDVAGHDGTKTVRLAVERGGSICGALALYVRRIPSTPWTFLVSPRGPVADLADRDAVRLLLDGAAAVARSHRAVFLRLDPDYPDDHAGIREALGANGFIQVARDWSLMVEPRAVMRVDLRPSEAQLLAAMRGKHRQHINGAEKRGLQIRTASYPSGVNPFARMMADHGREKGFSVRGPAYYQALWRHFIQAGRGELFLVERSGALLAGGLAVVCGRKSWFLYTASGPDARKLFPGEVLYWHVMRWARNQGADMCDFGAVGTAWPPEPHMFGYQRYFFKLGFNAQPVRLTGYYDLIFRPALYRMFRLAEDLLLDRSPAIVGFLRGGERG